MGEIAASVLLKLFIDGNGDATLSWPISGTLFSNQNSMQSMTLEDPKNITKQY